jgi:hypothetical protein
MAYGDGKICRAAPLVLSLMQAFSCISEIPLRYAGYNLRITFLDVAWFTITLSPILTLLLFRRICVLVGTMAVPIVAIFLGSVHYGSLFSKYGPVAIPQMGDWSMWLNSFFGLASVIIVAAWIFVRTLLFLIDFFIRTIASFRKTKA